MSEDENFLSRWSRKKREAVEQPPQDSAAAADDAAPKQSAAVAPSAAGTEAMKSEAGEPKFDLASLPSIDSIGPDTDIRMFLRAGVPAELTRAALRRAWSSDPAIRDYIGLSENSWNFNAPEGIYGFDLSDPGVDIKRLAEEMFGIMREPGEQTAVDAPPPSTEETPAESLKAPPQPELVASASDHDMLKSAADSVQRNTDRVPEQGLLAVQENSDAAMRYTKESEVDPLPVRKRHGGALPS